ncbi:MAG: tellurium resistance protein TerC [Candidatus Rokuibacteriota bacterium]|nr:MAG: tellurium resistance protein TerC [Candidatus Rokubacteria bacterium]
MVAPGPRRLGARLSEDVMALLADPEFWLRLLGIGMLNLLLSGDNALVIALAVRALPRRKRLLGQIWGAAGAVVLRLIFVGIVSVLLRIPLLQLVGGLLLVWIAVRLVRPETAGESRVRRGASLWEAIWIIIVADVTMSLDNVLAIAATAHGDFLLVMFGIGLSLPIVIWGAGLLALLMNRYTWIVWLGGGLLGYVAGEMLIEDPVVQRRLGESAAWLHYAIPIGIGVAVTAFGWWLGRGRRHVHVPENL